jgi:phosphate transport system ATP-binding protein
MTSPVRIIVPNARHLAVATAKLTEKVSIRHLNFYYGKTRALNDVSLALYANNVTAIIGPSGCGKSTLLRVFNRIYKLYPDQRAEGEVLLDGKDILRPAQDVNELRARIGMVFQQSTPFPMSIRDNIALAITSYESLSHSELDARVESALARAAI